GVGSAGAGAGGGVAFAASVLAAATGALGGALCPRPGSGWPAFEADCDGASAAALARDEGVELRPTMYPIAKKTPNRMATTAKPLSNCRLPSTSSNSPVSFFGINQVRSPEDFAALSIKRPNDEIISIGSGKTMVVFFSVPNSTNVCR